MLKSILWTYMSFPRWSLDQNFKLFHTGALSFLLSFPEGKCLSSCCSSFSMISLQPFPKEILSFNSFIRNAVIAKYTLRLIGLLLVFSKIPTWSFLSHFFPLLVHSGIVQREDFKAPNIWEQGMCKNVWSERFLEVKLKVGFRKIEVYIRLDSYTPRGLHFSKN